MAKYGSGAVVIEFDNSSGTLVNMTQHVLELGGIDVQAVLEEDAHTFGDTWREVLATGVKRAEPITIGGFYDDTATTGPDAIFNSVGSERTLKVTHGGTKTTSVEAVIQSYRRRPQRNQLTRYEVSVIPTGAVTES